MNYQIYQRTGQILKGWMSILASLTWLQCIKVGGDFTPVLNSVSSPCFGYSFDWYLLTVIQTFNYNAWFEYKMLQKFNTNLPELYRLLLHAGMPICTFYMTKPFTTYRRILTPLQQMTLKTLLQKEKWHIMSNFFFWHCF